MELLSHQPGHVVLVGAQPLQRPLLLGQSGFRLVEPAPQLAFRLLQLAVLGAGVDEDDAAAKPEATENDNVDQSNEAARVHVACDQRDLTAVSKVISIPLPAGQIGVRFPCGGARSPRVMYQRYYGLREMPFNITPDPRFLFLGAGHEEALAHLRYGVEERKGFIAIVGEVGCGKTTLCRQFLNTLDPARFDTALILNPRVTETQMLRAILTELGEEHLGRTQPDLVAQVNRVLLERIARGRDIVLIIDEAQNLAVEVLEQIRLLSNLETDRQKLLQIVLLGQPELKALLARDDLRQLRQRILVHYELKPFSAEETSRYIQHRLALAGSAGRPTFTRWALRKLHAASGGVPRLVNTLCDRAILAAFVRESDEVNYLDARRAVKELSALTGKI